MQHKDNVTKQPELPNEIIQHIFSFASPSVFFPVRTLSRRMRDNVDTYISYLDNIIAVLSRANSEESFQFLAYYRHTLHYQTLINKPLNEMNAKEVICYALTRGLEPVRHQELINLLEWAMNQIKLDDYTNLHLSIILHGLKITFANQMALPIDKSLQKQFVCLLNKRPLNLFLNLCGMDLKECELCGANLNGADLRKTNLTSAKLHKANLTFANLEGANLNAANLSGTDMNRAYLYRANLEKTILETTPPWGLDIDFLCKNIRDAIFLPRSIKQYSREYVTHLARLSETFQYPRELSIAIAKNALILVDQIDHDKEKLDFINHLLCSRIFPYEKPKYKGLYPKYRGLCIAFDEILDIRNDEVNHQRKKQKPEMGRNILQNKKKEIMNKLGSEQQNQLNRISI